MKRIVFTLFVALVSSLFAQTSVQDHGSATTNSSNASNSASAASSGADSSQTNSSNTSQQSPQGVNLSPAASQQTQSDPSDLAELLAPKPLPADPRLSLIGGTVASLDRVRNRMEVSVFGGKKMRVDFDQRTHIYRDGVETTSVNLKKGDRVYLDTMLYGSHVFAKNINVAAQAAQADLEGQLESVDLGRKIFAVRDSLTGQTMPLSLSAATTITSQGHSGSASDLVTGSLVRVHYASLGPGRPIASSVSVLAARGNNYVFYGEVSHIDKRLNMIAIRSTTGDRFYDISVEGTGVPDNLRIGSTARVSARFDGTKYVAQNIVIEQPSSAAATQKKTEENEEPGQQNPNPR